jgi:hypothetical protein
MMSFGKPGKENGVFPCACDYDDGKEIFKPLKNPVSTATRLLLPRRSRPGRPNSNGTSRKNVMAEIDHSLRSFARRR